ncbi:tonB-system energizer ExbB [Kosakonia cowanii]|nr:tonB-system energizer ExbB [Kosakonia cowanii]
MNFTSLRRERLTTRHIVLAAAAALIFATTFAAHAQDAAPSATSGATSIQDHMPATAVNTNGSADEAAGEIAGDNASQPELRQDLPHNLSPWGMFMSADWVVKAVMTGLAMASLMTWTIWVAKTIEIACARARLKRSLAAIMSSADLDSAAQSLAGRGGPAAFMVRSAEEEMRRSHAALDHAGDAGVKERLASRLSRIEAQAGRRLSKGTGMLATIGSTAPFVGLFGTVWGIMNAFIGISESQTTNLAIVAPGIAEALLATAIGLVAAIPAVVIYNLFARAVTGYRQSLADAGAGVEQLVSLGLDYRKVPAAHEHVHFRAVGE